MNKRTIIALCVTGLAVVIFLAALLIGKDSQYEGADIMFTTAADQDVMGSGLQSETATQSDTNAETDFTAAAGVSNKEDWSTAEMPEGSPQNTMETQGRQDASTAQPYQGEQKDTARESTAVDDGMPDVILTYEKFIQLDAAGQDAYFLQFADPRDYAAWLRKAKKEYEDNQTSIIITGPIDLSTLPVDAG